MIVQEQIIQIGREILSQIENISRGINNPWTIIVPLAGVLVALLLGVVGIFQDWIRVWFRKPKLIISIKVAPPDYHKTSFYQTGVDRKVSDTYYFRFRVENDGNYYAEDTEAMVTEVYKKSGSEYKKIDSFLPLNLIWSHYLQMTMPKIQPKLFKHLDFGHILESNSEYLARFGIKNNTNIFFELDVAVRPNTGSHILLPGDYRVKIIFAGNNLKPLEKIYNLMIKDGWNDNEEEMLQNNITIEEAIS